MLIQARRAHAPRFTTSFVHPLYGPARPAGTLTSLRTAAPGLKSLRFSIRIIRLVGLWILMETPRRSVRTLPINRSASGFVSPDSERERSEEHTSELQSRRE